MPSITPVELMARDNKDWSWCWGREMMMTVHKNKAYVIGGFVAERNINDRSQVNTFSNPDIWVFDFSKDIDVSSAQSPFVTKIPIPLETIPAMKWGAFWSLGDDSDKLLLSQGELEYYRVVDSDDHNSTLSIERTPSGGKIFEYTVSSDSWRVKQKPAGITNSVSKIAQTYSNKSGKGYFVGGQIWENVYMDKGETRLTGAIRGPNPVGNAPQTAMIVYDNKDQSWKNITSSVNHNEFATLSSLDDVGDQGILVLVGGQTGVDNNRDGKVSFRSFESVQIYDAAAGKWYNQPTTAEGGFFPEKRIMHCAVAKSAPDGTSHNIYIFGGEAEQNQQFLSDTWVLTIPAFHWVNLGAKTEVGLSDMACHRLGENYMFVFAGKDTSAVPTAGGTCDTLTGGRLLDLSAGEWVSKYQTKVASTYKVPEAVYKVIGGNGDGGATFVEPKKGFVEPGLEELLKIKKVETPTPGASSSPTPSGSDSTPSGNATESKSSLGGGAIAGIAIGAAALIGLAALIFFLVRRKKKENFAKSQPGFNELDGQGRPKPSQPAEYYTYKQPLSAGAPTEYSSEPPVEKDSEPSRVELPSESGRVYHEMDSTVSTRR